MAHLSDSDLQTLFRRAINDPTLQSVYLASCERVDALPTEPVGLAWEIEEIHRQERKLVRKTADFCLRYIENLLRRKVIPDLIIQTDDTDFRHYTSSDLLWYSRTLQEEDSGEDDDFCDYEYLDVHFTKENETITRCLPAFHSLIDYYLSLKFSIIDDRLMVYWGANVGMTTEKWVERPEMIDKLKGKY